MLEMRGNCTENNATLPFEVCASGSIQAKARHAQRTALCFAHGNPCRADLALTAHAPTTNTPSWAATAFACLVLGACSSLNPPLQDTATTPSFQVDPSCNETAPLEVVLGEWLPSEEFTPLTVQDPPLPIFGPQGGQHFLVALEVINPALDHPGARLSFNAALCAESCEDDSQWLQVGSAEVDSMDSASNWLPQNDGTLRLGSFFLVLETWDDTQEARITSTMMDACTRTADVFWRGRTGQPISTY